jgi:hypothetical protein
MDILSPMEANDVLQEVMEWEQSLPDDEEAEDDHHNINKSCKITGNLRFKPHLFLPKLNHHVVRNAKLIDAVQAALQSHNILLWSCDLNIKEPQSHMYFMPHQDATYTGLHPAQKCLTAWIALTDPVSEREGCLQFWKESHRLGGQLNHEEVSHQVDPYNILSRGQRIRDMTVLEKMPLVSIPLRGGQATLHHFHTVHQSGPNNHPNLLRIGLACRYMDATVRHVPHGPYYLSCTSTKAGDEDRGDEGHDEKVVAVRECVTLISGQTLHDGFELEPILPENPTKDQIEQGRNAQVVGMEREAANYFQGSQAQEYT